MILLNKKGGILFWIILVVIILAIIGAVTLYFVFTGDGDSIISSGNNIPTPPPLPSG